MGRERIQEKLRMAAFAYKWNVSREDMEIICQGSFNEWKVDFDSYFKKEIRNRIETGVVHKIDINDVWGGSQWAKTYI